jgi:23S rRNA (uracil1939-C5)-methyltransferase
MTGRKFDAIVMDPPRKGCSERVLMGLVKLDPSIVLYISCNAATLARDGSFLIMNGYSLKSATPFDMFPQTFHVESIAVFEKK